MIRAGLSCLIIHPQSKRFLLGLRNDRSASGFGEWGYPGGALEPNESPRDGAQRELLEETGLEVELHPVHMRPYSFLHVDGKPVVSFHFYGRLHTPELPRVELLEPDKVARWAWFDELPPNVFADLKNARARTVLRYLR